MIVVLAEKNKVAKIFSRSLFGHENVKNFGIEGVLWGEKCIISYTEGHMFGLKMPEDLNPKFKRWRLEDLPFPLMQEYKPSYMTQEKKDESGSSYLKSVFFSVRDNLKKASTVIIATDCDEQGEYIGHLVLREFGFKGEALRYFPNSLDPESIRSALSKKSILEPLKTYEQVARSEEARSKLDHLVGINLTRLYTCLALNKYGSLKGLPAIGRVQSPILGIVARRHIEREKFIALNYYNLKVQTLFSENRSLEFKVDLDRFSCRDELKTHRKKIEDGLVKITKTDGKSRVTPPPPPYKLATLQSDIDQYSPKEVLDALDKNYNEGYNTYPRTDSDVIEFFDWEAAQRKLSPHLESLGISLSELDFSKRGKTVLAKGQKAGAHTGVIPTGKPWDLDRTGIRWLIFKMISTRFAMMFMKDRIINTSKIFAVCNGYKLYAEGKICLQTGWSSYSSEINSDSILPKLQVDEVAIKKRVSFDRQSTQRPKRYIAKDLIYELGNIKRHLSDEARHLAIYFDKAENAGLGSSATRSDCIDQVQMAHKLIGSIKEGKKTYIDVTELGKAVHDALPSLLTIPDFFASWEKRFSEIANGTKEFHEILKISVNEVNSIINQTKNDPSKFPLKLNVKKSGFDCPECGNDITRMHSKGHTFFLCSHCTYKAMNFNGEPLKKIKGDGDLCDDTSCSGHYTSRCGFSQKYNRWWSGLACNKCKKPRKKKIKPLHGDGDACDIPNCTGKYKTISFTKNNENITKLICDTCKTFRDSAPLAEPIEGHGTACRCGGIKISRQLSKLSSEPNLKCSKCYTVFKNIKGLEPIGECCETLHNGKKCMGMLYSQKGSTNGRNWERHFCNSSNCKFNEFV